MTDYTELFSPLRIKNVELPNRLVAPPLVQFRPITSAAGLKWYARLAAGGAGLIIVEATGVPRFGNDLTAESLRPLVDILHSHGAAAAIQLFPLRFGETADVNELNNKQIQSIIDQYGRAAEICLRAGFDGVEPHGAHNYLINQFFMPDVNRRTDGFGGSAANRGRFASRIVERISQEVGEQLIIMYRHTPVGKAYTLDDSLQFASELINTGVDLLDISPARDKEVGDLSEPFAKRFGVPVIAVNGMHDLDAAEQALRLRRCSLVAAGRQMIADAQWANKIRQGRADEVRTCLQCNKMCYDHVKKRIPVRCVLWSDDEVAALQ